jgi:hypothetical protein
MVRQLFAVRPAVEELEPRRVPTVTFAAQRTFATGRDPIAVVVADFNGDGLPDLAATNFTSNSVSVLLNTTPAGASTPTFAAPETFAVGANPISVAVADFNGDGRPDLAIANYNGGTVSVLLNTTPPGSGTVSFAGPRAFAVGDNPASVAVGEFNGDGRPDLVVSDVNDTVVSVLLNTTAAGSGTASFADQQFFGVGVAPNAVAVADFNGDGRPDLAVVCVNDLKGSTIWVLLNTTAAGASTVTFTAGQTFAASPITASAVAAADLNGDGRPDLIAYERRDITPVTMVSVLMNLTATGAGTAAFAGPQTFATGTSPSDVAVADLDGDGRPDLAVTNGGGLGIPNDTVSVLLNRTTSGTISFVPQETFAVGGRPYSVAVGDFNGDGRPDLVITNSADNTVSVLLNTTTPFASTVPVMVGQFGGQGVWEYSRAQATWIQFTPANASRLAADPQGDVVATFPTYGVWEYKPASGWREINGHDATLLDIDPTATSRRSSRATGWASTCPPRAGAL